MTSKEPTGRRQSQLLLGDLLKYLFGLARLHQGSKIGNAELSNGLRLLAQSLRPYRNLSVLELADIIDVKQPASRGIDTRPDKRDLILPYPLDHIGHETLERILAEDDYTKQQIAEVGAQRFGISRSKLRRLRKSEARDLIRAAMDHEKSLEVISHEAIRGGKARSG